jgi:glycosyltransferase involved in cell wall biosynthesis
LAAGTPCLVPDLGGMPDIIQAGRTGAVFAPDDGPAAARAAVRLWDEAPAMRAACRAEYEGRYTPQQHLQHLLAVYAGVACGRAP